MAETSESRIVAAFVTVNYGENEKLLINPDCRQLIFMTYLRQKCHYDKDAFIDVIDENGKLAMVNLIDPHKNVREIFEDRLIYIPVMLEKSSGTETGVYKTIKPLLTDWDKKYAHLEKKIKILTGELKRKKSGGAIKTVECKGRGVDRKPSANSKPDGVVRGNNAVSQSGRLTTTNARQSPPGKKQKPDTKVPSKKAEK